MVSVTFTLPEPVVIHDKFSKKEKPVFKQSFEASYALDEKVTGQNLTVHFQGCDNANCYFPEDRTFSIAASGAVARLDRTATFRCIFASSTIRYAVLRAFSAERRSQRTPTS